MNDLPKIMFAGLDDKVLDLLLKSAHLSVAGTNFIPDFCSVKTMNPINLLFKAIYYLRFTEKCYQLEKMLLMVFYPIKGLASPFFRRFASYLYSLTKNKLKIVDFTKTDQVVNFIKNKKIDILVVSNWWMLNDAIIYAPRLKTVNIHPSKLPKYRGSVPTLWALKNHDSETSVSFMILDSKMDGGDIIAQHRVPITPKDDAITLENKCDAIIKKYFVNDLMKYMAKEIVPAKQELTGSLTDKYYEYMKICWSGETGRNIANKIKLYPHLWPLDQCIATFQGRCVLFKSIHSVLEHPTGLPGKFFIKGLKLFVYCQDSVLAFKLFKDLNIINSLTFFFKRKGVLGDGVKK